MGDATHAGNLNSCLGAPRLDDKNEEHERTLPVVPRAVLLLYWVFCWMNRLDVLLRNGAVRPTYQARVLELLCDVDVMLLWNLVSDLDCLLNVEDFLVVRKHSERSGPVKWLIPTAIDGFQSCLIR